VTSRRPPRASPARKWLALMVDRICSPASSCGSGGCVSRRRYRKNAGSTVRTAVPPPQRMEMKAIVTRSAAEPWPLRMARSMSKAAQASEARAMTPRNSFWRRMNNQLLPLDAVRFLVERAALRLDDAEAVPGGRLHHEPVAYPRDATAAERLEATRLGL